MARYILDSKIDSVEGLKQFDVAGGYYFVPAESTDKELVFKRDEQ